MKVVLAAYFAGVIAGINSTGGYPWGVWFALFFVSCALMFAAALMQRSDP